MVLFIFFMNIIKCRNEELVNFINTFDNFVLYTILEVENVIHLMCVAQFWVINAKRIFSIISVA